MPKLDQLQINNTFTHCLPADIETSNFSRQVYNACFSYVNPIKTAAPKLIIVSKEMIAALGIEDAESDSFLQIVTGNCLIKNSQPYAMCYGGHQFGHWAGQLGDGRAINLAQIESNEKSWTLQLKGAGTTPYSRSADGLAVLRSSIREFLCSEAMHALGVKTSRALSLALTGNKVMRDVLYNGNPAYEQGAIVCRVSASFIRFGSFEILSARKDFENLKKLTDYCLSNYYTHLGDPSKEAYIAFLNEVAIKTADMIINWQRVGFVHGVMNTDNMSILGETIDYGPYGWIENFDEEWTPNTTDAQNRRYRFGNQGNIGLWNLTQLANALYPLIEDVSSLEKVLENYRNYYNRQHFVMLNSKLGLYKIEKDDSAQMKKLLLLMTNCETDMTIFYRNLVLLHLDDLPNHLNEIRKACYCSIEIFKENEQKWKDWLQFYAHRINLEGLKNTDRMNRMNSVNPKFVLRNYMAQQAIEEAEKGNFMLIDELHQLLKNPYNDQNEMHKWFCKRPDWAKNKIGCSQLSCSS